MGRNSTSQQSNTGTSLNSSKVKSVIQIDIMVSSVRLAAILGIPLNPFVRHYILKQFSFGTLEVRRHSTSLSTVAFMLEENSFYLAQALEWVFSLFKGNKFPFLTDKGKSRIVLHTSNPKVVKKSIRQKYGLIRYGETFKLAEKEIMPEEIRSKLMPKFEDDFETTEVEVTEKSEKKSKKVKKDKPVEKSEKKVAKVKKEKEVSTEKKLKKSPKVEKEEKPVKKVVESPSKEQTMKTLVKKIRSFLKEAPVARIDNVTIAKFVKKDAVKPSFMRDLSDALSEARCTVSLVKDEECITLFVYAATQPKRVTIAYLKA